MTQTPDRIVHVACLSILLATTGIGVAVGLAPPTTPAAPAATAWQRRCTEAATLDETSVVPASATASLAFGSVPMGPYGIKIESRSICQAETWECPTGRTCDPAAKPADIGSAR